MSGGIIFLILLAALVLLVLGISLLNFGINLCKKNNGTGLFVLFLVLNILGLVLGIGILYNAKNGMYIEELKKEEQRKKQKIELENSETFDSFNKEKEPQTNKLP
ncbi:hypothetical protein [Spiroplasma sp. AdecLV25b]|uniref:hypothetical protein n=1 Tax=Spiroplasma sp. AdecLV25b TaxID=3027162 RepID=UPI0027DEBF26|nr:hypothetical protein [Spiroplasma sp. AdecLV25b]